MLTVETLNALGAAWAGGMTRSLVDASVILAVVFLVWFPFRRRISSQMAYGLFLLVLLKAAFPVPVELPGAVDRFVPGSTADRLLPFAEIHPVVVFPPRQNQPTHTTPGPVPPGQDDVPGVAGLEDGLPAVTPSSTDAIPAVALSLTPTPAGLMLKPELPRPVDFRGDDDCLGRPDSQPPGAIRVGSGADESAPP